MECWFAQGIDLEEVNLENLDLKNINFKYANLSHCILTSCDLSHCNLEKTQLKGAVLDVCCVCVCMCMCTYVCVHASVCPSTPVHMFLYMHVCRHNVCIRVLVMDRY